MRLLAPITSIRPGPVDTQGVVDRLRLTLVSAGYALAGVPALALAIVLTLAIPLGLISVGFLLALAAVPATSALAEAHRRVSGALLATEIPVAYADTSGAGAIGRPMRWVRDPARWRDLAFVWFSATGGAAMSLIPPVLLAAPVPYLVGAVVDPGWLWVLLLGASGLGLVGWWIVTPPLVRARASAEAAIFRGSRVRQLERRVEQVTESRSASLDLAAKEIRRIERDLHDGAQARMAAVGMTLGLAGQLVRSDPDAAAALVEEARAATLAALEDLRSVVRGIHPPVLADRGLAGAIEALAVQLPLATSVVTSLPRRLPDPVESAAYFAIAECLTNTIKHARATSAHVHASHDGSRLRIVVGDDGRGGADPSGTGLIGVARRLAAFDGTLAVDSPPGGPTVVTMEIPCES
jgi:signal transduction histidine kinase